MCWDTFGSVIDSHVLMGIHSSEIMGTPCSVLGPNTPEQGAMPSHMVLHTAWQELAIGIEEVTA